MGLFEKYVDDGLTFVTKKCIQAIPQVCITIYFITKYIRCLHPFIHLSIHLPILA